MRLVGRKLHRLNNPVSFGHQIVEEQRCRPDNRHYPGYGAGRDAGGALRCESWRRPVWNWCGALTALTCRWVPGLRFMVWKLAWSDPGVRRWKPATGQRSLSVLVHLNVSGCIRTAAQRPRAQLHERTHSGLPIYDLPVRCAAGMVVLRGVAARRGIALSGTRLTAELVSRGEYRGGSRCRGTQTLLELMHAMTAIAFANRRSPSVIITF